MKFTRIVLIIISILTLISATLTLCRIIPTMPGLVISLSLVICEFIVQAVVAYKVRNKISMTGYIVAAVGLAAVITYNLFL